MSKVAAYLISTESIRPATMDNKSALQQKHLNDQ